MLLIILVLIVITSFFVYKRYGIWAALGFAAFACIGAALVLGVSKL